MKPKISIIVPVYNTARFLKKCINSIINQSFKEWELVIVNDASPDNSSEILSYFENKDKRIKIVNHPQNKGVDQSRFTGLEHATAQYVMFVDSDDWLNHNALQILYTKIEEEHADIVFGSMVRVIDNYKILKSKPGNAYTSQNLTGSICQPELFEKYYISYFGVNRLLVNVWAKLYRRSTIDKAQLKPTFAKMGEDLVFNMELHPFLEKIAFVTDAVYYYRFGGMTTKLNPLFLDNMKSQYLLKKECIEKFNYRVAAPYIRYELINCFYTYFYSSILYTNCTLDTLREEIRNELTDSFYDDSLFEGIDLSEKAIALKTRDMDAMIQVIQKKLKAERPKHRLKMRLFKVFNLFARL